MSKLIYLGCYSCNQERAANPAAMNMMDYIISSINNVGKSLRVLSHASTADGSSKDRETIQLSGDTELVYLKYLGKTGTSLLSRAIRRMKVKWLLYKELGDLINDGDTVIVYHSLSYIDALRKLRRKKKFKLILQVCEIYSTILENEKMEKKELAFINEADSYIFSSDLLEKRLNNGKKPYAICLGNYTPEPKLGTPKDDKIHITYAGTFNLVKGGVLDAIRCAEFLDEGYHLHLFGHTEKSQMKIIIKELMQVGAKTRCEITYEGFFSGDEFKKRLQENHIGLSTQNMEKAFNETSFPSKILTYISNGLRVVSGKIPAVYTSAVGGDVAYYDKRDAEEMARAIRSVCLDDDYDGRKIVSKLDDEFKKELVRLI
ncbi:MAG: hypothetical protein IJ309_04455 [Clostridia bacterium]|nr:hypothetical protein [Clostridia bacterium]